MALGRSLFVFSNHLLYEVGHYIFGIQPHDAYLIFKYAVVVQSPLAVIACWLLARDVSSSIYTATIAAFSVALSPVFVLYGGQVMTDVPSVLVLAVALVIHLRGVRQDRPWLMFLGAAILGLGVNLRETVGLFGPWLLLAPLVIWPKLDRRHVVYIVLSVALFLIFALGWFGYWFISDPHYRLNWFGWRESMRQESARHPVTVRNLVPYIVYFFITGPLIFLSLPFAIVNQKRRNARSALLLLGGLGLFANLLLFFNYSTAVNWRYFLTGLPAIAPLSSDYLLRRLSGIMGDMRRALLLLLASLVVFATIFGVVTRPVSQDFIQRRALSKEYRHRLANVPKDGVLISGAQTIAVTYWRAMGLGNWQTIGTGGGWPGDDLVPQIERYLTSGQRVFLDSDPRWWLPCAWQRDEIYAIVDLEKRFRFRRVTETIYELRPLDDASAVDAPNLQRLLPENRPADTIKCSPNKV
jgi:hypothetical protein